eukprot:9715956-Ditylum_brightwellii.AAC.1
MYDLEDYNSLRLIQSLDTNGEEKKDEEDGDDTIWADTASTDSNNSDGYGDNYNSLELCEMNDDEEANNVKTDCTHRHQHNREPSEISSASSSTATNFRAEEALKSEDNEEEDDN